MSPRIFLIANSTLAVCWIYHGMVPKLLFMETGELEMMKRCGFFAGYEPLMVQLFGIGEILFGLSFFFMGRNKLLHYINIYGLIALGIAALILRANVYVEPFNPATTSLGLIALSWIVLSGLNTNSNKSTTA